ncbi:MAG: restriction endonuclease subunit S [Candidatus Paceibacterota bacterium]
MITYSIIQKSQLEGAKRMDAEYYKPEYLNSVKIIEKYGYKNLGDLLEILTDYHANGSYEVLKRNVQLSNKHNFALMVRSVDLETGNFDTDVRYVSEKAYNFLKKTKVFGREIFIDKIGNTGAVYLMPKLNRPVTLGMNLFMLRLKEEIDPEFLYVFLNSKLGKSLISQRITGAVPTSIDKASVRSIKVPVISRSFSNEIRQLVKKTFVLKEESKSFYFQAENLLLEELGLKNFESKSRLWSVVNLSEAKKVNRIDAEYFQPKYQKILSLIRANGGIALGELATVKKGFEPGSEAYQEEGKLFIRVSSVSKDGITNKDQKYLKDELYNELKKDYQPKVGEILLTKDASPGIAYVVKEPIEGIVSGGVLRVKVKDNIEPEYCALVINSIVGQSQVERDAGGSIIAHWKPDQVKELQVPILSKPTQQKIADFVQKSHEARKEAKELLEEAKHKVEEMIESKNK